MSRTSFTVTGRITRKDTNAGVHGLRVEIWDDELSPDKQLGSGLTNRDGYFHIRFCPPDSPECCDACPRVYVKVRDRDCRVDVAPFDRLAFEVGPLRSPPPSASGTSATVTATRT